MTRALRIAHSLDASIDDLVERIYWNPGEIAPRPSERRPAPTRLSGFFLVLPPNVSVFEPAVSRVIADRHEAAALCGQNVRDARERRHLTQMELARAAGLSKAGLSLIERGLSETTVDTLLALARGLEVAPEILLGGIAWKPRMPLRARPKTGGAQRHAARSLDRTIRRLWCDGRTAREIGAAVGTSPGSVSAIVHRLREHGHELPYRNLSRSAVHQGARDRRRLALREMPEHDPNLAAGDELVGADVAARVGANVATLRRERGLTQEQVGEAIESDRTYVRRIEAGANVPRLGLVIKLAASLNVRCSRITAGVRWRHDCGRFCLDEEAEETVVGMVRLGRNVREARRWADISQQALGVRAEVSRGDIVDFELGKRNFRIFTALKIAGALGVDLAVLFAQTSDSYVRPLPAPEYAPGDRAPSKVDRDALLVRLWRDGTPEREIAEALDLADSAVAPYVRDLRNMGVDLPYRRPSRTPTEAAARRRREGRRDITVR